MFNTPIRFIVIRSYSWEPRFEIDSILLKTEADELEKFDLEHRGSKFKLFKT